MEGLTDKTFGPNFGTSRAVVAEAMWQMAGKPEVEETQVAYTDVAVDSAYSKAIAWTTEQGIYTGFGDATTLAPLETVTRAETATIIERLCETVIQ